MKNCIVALLTAFIAVATALLVGYAANTDGDYNAESEYFRIHVRANSNGAEDQKVKYEVKDEVVAFVTPYITECTTKQRAIEVIGGLTDEIAAVCDTALRERGYTYGARARVCAEEFPTRVYGDLTLESGVYDALIVELGEGTGDNWWCVIYPPLCFTAASASVEYRSLIYDIINGFYKK